MQVLNAYLTGTRSWDGLVRSIASTLIGCHGAEPNSSPSVSPPFILGERQCQPVEGVQGAKPAFMPMGLSMVSRLIVILIVLERLLLVITRYLRERRRRKEEAEGAAGQPGGLDDALPTGEVPASLPLEGPAYGRWCRSPGWGSCGGNGGRRPARAAAASASPHNCQLRHSSCPSNYGGRQRRVSAPPDGVHPGTRPRRTDVVCPMMSA